MSYAADIYFLTNWWTLHLLYSDWYNLEKSKRVKAFRCGEFDDCITKAESSQGNPIKKREKYARREDAILHALELERLQLEKKQQKLGISNAASRKMSILPKKESVALSESLVNDHSEIINLKSRSISKAVVSSHEEDSMENPEHSVKAKYEKQLSWDDGNSETIPRMRGLQDFGLRTAPSKRKLPSSEGYQKHPSVNNHAHDFANVTRSMSGANVSSSKNSLASKKKRSHGSMLDDPLSKDVIDVAPLFKCYKIVPSWEHLPLCNLRVMPYPYPCKQKRIRMESSAEQKEVVASIYQLSSLTEETTSSGMEGAESGSSQQDYLDPDGEQETSLLSDSNHSEILIGSGDSRRYMNIVRGQGGSMSSEELEDPAISYLSRRHGRDHTAVGAADAGMSKWQLKGKRNIRNLMKKPIDDVGKSSKGTYFEGKGNSLNRSLGHGLYDGNEPLGYDYDEDELIEKSSLMQTQMMGFGNGRYPSMLRVNSKIAGRSIPDTMDSEDDSTWETDGLSQAAYSGYLDESGEFFDQMYVGHRPNGKSTLVDVDVKVQASYQGGEHVPLVSLMSRLNGKAIIGHPVQIEVLEDGSTDLILSMNDDDDQTDYDGNAAVPPVWKTARRTAMHRVPRPHPLSALDGDETADLSQYSELESKRLLAGHSNQKSKKSSPSIRQFHEKKYSKKPVKKVSLSSQKTRTLSSIAIEHKLNGKGSKVLNKNYLGGLIKPEPEPTTVACIPVKLVFSRLLEAVGRSPSRITNHNVSTNGDTEKKST
ncbi:hypothetical protein Sjap_004076 [Stephania japonica]|uniref:Uncharacterized protein n=1 Tax=Stephania japonica TaxID=461633 RepID=A0AAP0PGP6_9MAGN